MRKLITVVAAASLLAALVAPGAQAAPSAAKKKKKPKKVTSLVVGTDAKGDFFKGGAPDPSLDGPVNQVGDGLGMDLVSATVAKKDAKTLSFQIKLASLPAPGGSPEVVRYIWSATVNGKYVELDGKWSNFSRGVCDPTAGCGPDNPPRNPGVQPFLVRGNCVTDATANLTTCQELGIVSATFDAATSTITIPVPMALIKAKSNSKIGPGSSEFTGQAGGNILAIASAFVSRSDFPRDAMAITKTFTV